MGLGRPNYSKDCWLSDPHPRGCGAASTWAGRVAAPSSFMLPLLYVRLDPSREQVSVGVERRKVVLKENPRSGAPEGETVHT